MKSYGFHKGFSGAKRMFTIPWHCVRFHGMLSAIDLYDFLCSEHPPAQWLFPVTFNFIIAPFYLKP